MLISEKLNQKMNEQIGNEFGASNQYLSIAAHFDSEALPELSKFFYLQADEEREHALKFLHYLIEAGGSVAIPAVAKPESRIESAEHAFQMSLDWELEVTAQINNLMSIAIEDKDYIGQDFLRWFVAEQLEEVSSMEEMQQVVRRSGEERLFYVENYLVRRVERKSAAGGE
ncbi:MAG: ferritin [Anaerolineales bacterium]|nr:ferritin [Anaerolineales bacterium]